MVVMVGHQKASLCSAHQAAAASLDRRSTKNPRRGAPQTQADPARAKRNGSPGQALIEFDLGQ